MPTNFSIPGQFTVDGVNVNLGVSTPNASVLNAIDTNAPFPAGDITVGSLSASASTGNPIQLGDATKNISFSANAGSTYSISILSDPNTVAKTLNANSNITSGIDLTAGTSATDRFAALQLTYKLGATAKGAAALGAGVTINFGANGSLNGDWDVVHRFPGATGAFDALSDTFSAWRLPRQISAPGQLPPGTWIVSEVAGSLNMNVGVQAGYDYTWVKQLGGNLTGDIGLKVALAASASLGFSANGDYALALSRQDASNKVRLAIYKLSKLGWNFAFNASAGVQGQLPPALQKSTDVTDLIKAMFGVQATQLINDLKLVQKVAAGGKLTDQAANYLVSLGQTKIPGVSDAIAEFNAGVDAVNQFISQLDSLGQRTTNQLLSLLPQAAQADIATFKTVLGDIQTVAADPTKIGSIVVQQLQQVAFFQTPFGQWLSAFLEDAAVASPLAALADNTVLHTVGVAATTTLNLLNGGDLQTLINFAAQKLDLKNIPTLQNIDKWLVAKVAAFLNKAVPSVVQQDLTNIQNTVNLLFTKANQFWTAAITAAQKKYEMTFVAKYEEATTNTALIDVVFDFDANPNLGQRLQDAINGNFTELLIDPTIAGIQLNTGVLTHGYHSQTHVEFAMPFINFDIGSTSTTDVMSKLNVKNDGSVRVLAYTVQASNDTLSFVQGRSSRDGQMTLAMSLQTLGGVNKARDFKATMGYALRAAYAKTSTQLLINTLSPIITPYALPLNSTAEVTNWAIDFDKVAENVPSGQLGEALIALDVAVDPAVLGFWLQAPAGAKDPAYFALSLRIQDRLRTLIPSVYFSNLSNYGNLTAAYSVILYSALRRINSFDVADDGSVAPTNADIFWSSNDGARLTALANDGVTQTNLLAAIRSVHQVLQSVGSPSPGSYTDNAINSILSVALHTPTGFHVPVLLGGLIVFEAQFIDAVVSAATSLAKAVANAGTNPAAALTAFSNFSAATVKTFNQMLGSQLFDGPQQQLLGSALFTEISLALAEAVLPTPPPNAQPSALFSVTVMQPNASISLDNLRQGKFAPSQVFVEQKLASPLPALAKAGVLAAGVAAPANVAAPPMMIFSAPAVARAAVTPAAVTKRAAPARGKRARTKAAKV